LVCGSSNDRRGYCIGDRLDHSPELRAKLLVSCLDLLEAEPAPRDLLADKGFNGKAFAGQLAAQGTAVLVPPTKDQRASMSAMLLKVIAQRRNRIEASFGEITDRMELARHGAHSFWGLLARTAATIAAHTLLRACLAVA